MKKSLLCGTLMLGALSVSAQEAAQVDVKDAFTYNRSSLTVVPLCGLVKSMDHHVRNWADTVSFGGKFDMNRVAVQPVELEPGVYIEAYTNPATAPKTSLKQKFFGNADAPQCLSEAINAQLNGGSLGKDILSYWLGFDGQYFNPALWEARSMYNASDADVLNDRAAKVKTLALNGLALMNNTYVLVAGPTEVKEIVDKKGNVSYTATSDAYVYRMVMTPEIKEFINNQYLSKPEPGQKLSEKEIKEYNKNLADYNSLKVTFEPVATVANVGSASESLSLGSLMAMVNAPVEKDTPAEKQRRALVASTNGVLEPLEGKIPAWEVVTTVYTKSPLGSKIGRKEGLKNCDRYGAYKLVEDENGELHYKHVGWVRATTVCNNAFVADGESPCSNFYQLSGMNLREGMFLKQKKDLKLSASISGMFNGISPALLDVDYLLYTHHTMGTMLYAGLSIGGYAGDVDCNYGGKGTWVNGALNVTGAVHPIRWVELAAQVGAGSEYFRHVDDLSSDDESDDAASKRMAYFAHGGVRIGFQVWYPVQLFVRADYNYKISDGERYCNSSTARFDQLGFGAGVKVNF